jgi:hypothetical protein
MLFLSYIESNKVCILNTTLLSFRMERNYSQRLDSRPTQTILGALWVTVMIRRKLGTCQHTYQPFEARGSSK